MHIFSTVPKLLLIIIILSEEGLKEQSTSNPPVMYPLVTVATFIL